MASHLFQGVTDSTMAHGEGWHFGYLGRLLERANMTSRILDVMYYHLLPDAGDIGGEIDEIRWLAVLNSVSAFEMYRQNHGLITPANVVGFLALNPEFPRSMLSCVTEAGESLKGIEGYGVGSGGNAANQGLVTLVGELQAAEIDEIIIGGLHEFIFDFQAKLIEVGSSIFETYFALPVTSEPINSAVNLGAGLE